MSKEAGLVWPTDVFLLQYYVLTLRVDLIDLNWGIVQKGKNMFSLLVKAPAVQLCRLLLLVPTVLWNRLGATQ